MDSELFLLCDDKFELAASRLRMELLIVKNMYSILLLRYMYKIAWDCVS